jgi:hypothetical protein
LIKDSERLVIFDDITSINELEGNEDEETPLKLCEAIKIMQRLRLFSSTQI